MCNDQVESNRVYHKPKNRRLGSIISVGFRLKDLGLGVLAVRGVRG